ncbi:MAG: hypothetical protein ABSE49_00375 [Polyangiaceae bacterium]|jgi:hypothetical protein
MFRCSKLHELSLSPGELSWPWVAFAPDRRAFAVPVGPRAIAIRGAASLGAERRVELPEALSLPVVPASAGGTKSRQPGLHALALHPDGRTVVGVGWHRDLPVACVERVGGAPELVDLGPALGDMGPLAATFTRDGESLWLSAEKTGGAAIARLRFRDFGLEAKVAFPAAPPPAAHELFLHPNEDAVLLTMACGQDGTFTRVARNVGDKVELVPTKGDEGLQPCGVAGTTDDGRRVCFVADDGVALRRWPELALDATVEVGDERATNYSGVRIGGRFLVSATDREDEEDERALVLSDALAIEDDAEGPPGMWAGRLGEDRLVTIAREEESKRRRVFVYAIEVFSLATGVLALLCAGCGSFKNGTGPQGTGDAGGASSSGGGGSSSGSEGGSESEGGSGSGSGGGDASAPPSGTNTEVLLFGGFDETYLGDTWHFDGVSWSESDGGSAPTGRLGASVAPLNGSVVLFGGEDTNLDELADTWVWNGTAWNEAGTSGPPGRSNAGMATLGDTVVLFGGEGDGGPIGDTWGWDGSTWKQLSAVGPSAREGPAMATLGNHVVLFGGRDTSFDDLADTWTWDGTSWTMQSPTHSPPMREFGVAATLGSTVVLFGGFSGPPLADTWTWDGNDWTQLMPTMPPEPRQAAGVATVSGHVVLFGGWDGDSTFYDDTWFWDGSQWTAASTMGPSYRGLPAMCGP